MDFPKKKLAIVWFKPRNVHTKEADFQEYIHTLEKRAFALRRQIETNYLPYQADCIINVSGDGPYIETIKQFAHLGIPFYGVNMGTYGFLLNNHEENDDIRVAIKRAVWVEFPLLDIEIEYLDGSIDKTLAFNDLYTKTSGVQTPKHRIFVNGQNIIPQVFDDRETLAMGDAVIVCSAGGSTAYNRAAGGKVFSPSAKVFGGTIASPFPIPFKPIQVPDTSEVVIEVLEDNKRQHIIIADNEAYTKVKRVTVRKSELTVTLGFKPGATHQDKVKEIKQNLRAWEKKAQKNRG